MIFVPSRGRRAGIERFFKECNPSLPGRVLIDEDDRSYDDMSLPDGWEFFVRPRDKTTVIINRAFHEFPKEPFYAVVGDDMMCKPPDWDLELAQSCGSKCVSWGDDGRWGSKLCPSFFVGGDLVRHMGWLVHPMFGHLYGDTVWWMIARGAGIARYRPDITIHHYNVKDKTYLERQVRGDHEAFEYLRTEGMSRLISKASKL